MKEFRSIEEYNKYLEDNYGFGLNEAGIRDLEYYVGKYGEEYVIYNVVEEFGVDDNVIKFGDRCFWICERYEGIRLVEIEETK